MAYSSLNVTIVTRYDIPIVWAQLELLPVTINKYR